MQPSINKKAVNTNEYISGFPPKTRELLETLRACIVKAAPKSKEVISYNMPAFEQSGILVYFAGYKNHIGFYPTSKPMKVFEKELSGYKTSKGAVQFPLDKKLPLTIISKIVKYRIAQTEEKTKFKNEKVCKNGHTFYKSSDCPVCPLCEKQKTKSETVFTMISAPARRALEGAGIKSVTALSKFSESEILSLHGMGDATISILRKKLATQRLSFSNVKTKK